MKKTHLNKEEGFFKNILLSDVCKIELFVRNGATHIWRRNGTAYDMNNTFPTVKHGGGSIMMWGCFSVIGVGTLEIIDGKWIESHTYKFLKIVCKS